MKVAAIIVLSTLLFLAALAYCFHDRKVSARPGSFYLLIAAIGCASLLISAVFVEGARAFRQHMRATPRTGDLLTDIATAPSGARFAAELTPRFRKPDTPDSAAWLEWQESLRQYLRDEVYALDLASSGSPPEARLLRETNEAGLTRKEFAITAADGDSIPAVLLMPSERSGPLPGIVVVPGHVPDGESGLAQLVLPIDSYHNSAARELAIAGFATLAIEIRGFGLRGPPTFPDHTIVAYNAVLAGSFYKRLALDDIRRALDLLLAQPEVDQSRIGITGASLGGELTVEYAALDERVRAISFHAHGGQVGPFPGLTDAGAEQPHYCHVIPGANAIMHQEDPFLLLAPRPTQGVRGEDYPREPFILALERVWTLFGAKDALDLRMRPDGTIERGHTYSTQAAIEFFRAKL